MTASKEGVTYLNVSKHGSKRIRERCGVSKKSVNRVAKIAFDQGLTHKELTGNLCKWVNSLYLKHHTGNQIRIYGDLAYIFDHDVLVTVIPVPNNLKKQVKIAFERRDSEFD